MENLSLYVHIPFCKSKCTYCNFVSYSGCEEYFKVYLKALKQEIEIRAKECKNFIIKTIYIGGGTPSILPLGSISNIIETIKNNFALEKNVEITVEANPNSLTQEKAIEWKTAGVNRISIGLQSANNKILKLLNRPHNLKDFKQAISYIKNAGILNISADMLIGLPKQNWFDIKKTIKTIIKQKVKHISAYGLILEPNTKLFSQVENNELKLPNEDKSVKFYNKTRKLLEKHKYICYEISNFSQQGFESRHNLNYWARGQFVGFGAGAYSFLNGVHYENTTNLQEYLKKPDNKLNCEQETIKTAKEEFIMLAMRLSKGLDIEKYNITFKTNFLEEYKNQIEKLQNSGLIIIENNFVKVLKTELTNIVIEEFF
ncbi:MAG: radical SAM family heme chaperone HemW [Clostridia bacterium]|nr:radical SAM family heme chaperone HemW [Clostridia bacterium]